MSTPLNKWSWLMASWIWCYGWVICPGLFNFRFELYIICKECRDSSCVERPHAFIYKQLIKELEWSKHFWPKMILSKFHFFRFYFFLAYDIFMKKQSIAETSLHTRLIINFFFFQVNHPLSNLNIITNFYMNFLDCFCK